jgi:threonyl-tRNA synthetase
MGIIIENYAGAFPLWLSPTQVTVIPVSDKYLDYAKQITGKLLDAGLRADANLSSDRVGYKIREASLQKVPYAVVVGEKEQGNQTINVRSRDKGELGEMTLSRFLDDISDERRPGGARHANAAAAVVPEAQADA